MQHAADGRMLQSLRRLADEADCFGERAGATALDAALQILAVNELGDDIIALPFLVDVVRVNQVRMIESHRLPRIGQELLEPCFVRSESPRHQFDGHALAKMGMFCQELSSNASDADLVLQAILTELELREPVKEL